MIRYHITRAELEAAIEGEANGWLAKANTRTAAFRKKRKYEESSSIWGEIKVVYMRLQGDSKCAFCERKLAAEEYGKGEQDVEHFRPKKNVRLWQPPQSILDKGITLTKPPGTGGYHLLPYHPFNYTASCKPCNSALKGDMFPIAGKYKLGGDDPVSLKGEKPYLIYPIGDIDDDPEALICFYGVNPQAVAKSGFNYHRALVTIEFFKLDDVAGRKDLFISRARAIVAMYPQLKNLKSGSLAEKRIAKGLVDGFISAKSEHANCARSFKKLFETSPDQAEELYKLAAEYITTNS
jgi:hypothetical protein